MTPKYVSGHLIGYFNNYEMKNVVQKILHVTSAYLPKIKFTHFSAGKDWVEKFIKWNENKLLEKVVSKEVTDVALAVFPSNEDPKQSINWRFKISISDTGSRGPRCLLFHIQADQTFWQSNGGRVVQVCDDLAVAFSIESGHLHDLDDFSDQNQRGPHWFKVTGKYLDPKKIKYSEILKEEIVDLEQNPCHLHVVGAIDFTASWTNYLGKEFIETVPVRNLSQLDAYEIKDLGPDLVRVTLFEDPFTSRDPENVSKLWDFRDKLRIDEIAHQFIQGY